MWLVSRWRNWPQPLWSQWSLGRPSPLLFPVISGRLSCPCVAVPGTRDSQILGIPMDIHMTLLPLPYLPSQLFSVMKLTFLPMSDDCASLSVSFHTEKETGRVIYWSLKNQQRLGKELFSVAVVQKWDQLRKSFLRTEVREISRDLLFFKNRQKGLR